MGIKLSKAKALFTLAVFVLLLSQPVAGASVTFSTGQEFLHLKTGRYEVAFDRTTGGLVRILDLKTGAPLSWSTKNANLWGVTFNNGEQVFSSTYHGRFTYKWNALFQRLTFYYQGTEDYPLDVTVEIKPRDDQRLQMQAKITNHSLKPIQTFHFPVDLKVAASAIQDALLPMVPGVKLNSAFFTDQQSFSGQYPGVMFADYVAYRTGNHCLAVYSQHQGRNMPLPQPVQIGFAAHPQDGLTRLVHDFKTWVEPGQKWSSPPVLIQTGSDYPETISAYREENRIDRYPALSQKLGAKKDQYFASPLYKLDFNRFQKPFTVLKTEVIDAIKVPGLIHPVAFQPLGHDHHYPDFLPPNPAYGSTEDLADFVKYAQTRGNLVVPYTNFSWWNLDSPTLQQLIARAELPAVTVQLASGHLLAETYASEGYVVNFHHDFVRQRIAEEQKALINKVGFDGIFEDQLGARNTPYDFNPAGLKAYDPATSYVAGVLRHASALKKNNIMTECGFDVLAKDLTGFCGTNYLWDQLGYRLETAPYTGYYPMIGMLCRDKVLLYQHNLAIETWTDDLNMFRWNLAYGYNFSGDLLDPKNPWLTLAGLFQKYVLARYADELVTGFELLPENVTCTTFESFKTYANWDPLNSFNHAGHVVVPGGALVLADDGSVTAGVFANYNGQFLSDGDHYLIEVRSEEEIKVFQPLGNDTLLKIKKNPSWPGVKIIAYDFNGQPVTEVEATVLDVMVSFEYSRQYRGQEIAYYSLTKQDEPNPESYPIPEIPELVVTNIQWQPAFPCTGDQVTFTATVKNVGTGPIPEGATLSVAFMLDGAFEPSFWAEKANVTLPAGATITLQATGGLDGPSWTATDGAHVVQAWVDKANVIPEINEGNNMFSKNLPTIDEGIEIAPGVRVPKAAANLALNQQVTASGATAPAYAAHFAVDGFINTYWESVNHVFPATLTLDLGAVKTVGKVVLKLPPSWEPRVQTISLYGGTDRNDLALIVAEQEYTFDPARENTVTIGFDKREVRYLQLVITANTTWPAGQIAELEVFPE